MNVFLAAGLMGWMVGVAVGAVWGRNLGVVERDAQYQVKLCKHIENRHEYEKCKEEVIK